MEDKKKILWIIAAIFWSINLFLIISEIMEYWPFFKVEVLKLSGTYPMKEFRLGFNFWMAIFSSIVTLIMLLIKKIPYTAKTVCIAIFLICEIIINGYAAIMGFKTKTNPPLGGSYVSIRYDSTGKRYEQAIGLN